MGSGEVAIVALSTMISLKVTFSDGLGGGILKNIGQKSFGIYCVHIIVIKSFLLLPFIAEYNNIYMWLILIALTIITSNFVGAIMENLTNKVIKNI